MTEDTKMRVAVSGASGLIGTALTAALSERGHDVLRLVRRPASGPAEIAWDPPGGHVEADKLEGLDAVVHLAGTSIAATRWTDARKGEIRRSRVSGTRTLAEALAATRVKPKAFLSASACGYYGDRGTERVDETSPPGMGFLADVCRAWEAAARPASDAGIRTVALRFGVVLSSHGGALAKMRLPFSLGLGGPIGSGLQGFSWIGRDDVVGAILHLMTNTSVSGPVNVVSPDPVTQREFARALGRALGRPAVIPLPAFAVKIVFGQMGEEALLSGAFVSPAVLSRSGFTWKAPRLDDALAGACRA
jgi:uncharacterized protein (TIGR01777 family)